nr:lipoprotein insertase outer membrane protein LolB [Pusillimonas sp. NJUB218]
MAVGTGLSMRLGRYRLWFRSVLVVWVAAILAACATPAAIQVQSADPAFQRSGRFAVSVEEVGVNPQAVQGGFAWYDAGHRLLLDLANPLGSTLARVEVLPGQAVLTRSNGTTQTAPNADALVQEVVGVAIPVAGLRDWLRGRTGQGLVQSRETDAEGRLTRFVQDGWSVTLSRYDNLGPGLLQLKRTEGQRSISVRLVVDAS